MATVVSTAPIQQTSPLGWRRWFRRTNVYIAEYILMLIFVGTLLGLLAGLWFSFFGLLIEDGSSANLVVEAAASQLAGLVVVAPVAFWLYARVTGEEMVHPELQRSRARLVFLTIWMIGLVCSIVGLAGDIIATIMRAIFGIGPDALHAFVGTAVPGVLALCVLIFGLFMVIKHVSRRFVMLAGIVLAASCVVLLFANAIMIFVKKDSTSTKGSDCGYMHLMSSDSCSLKHYQYDDSSYDMYR